ncbi:MAG: hypothetical protein FWB74_02410 [Defluviitaleaceae bacterium]|nr:hypothetical protein [Defluviitaleaceae bacterium]
MSQFYGYAGKILRVNLTDHTSSTESIDNYLGRYDLREYLGGIGFGYKVLWEEVPFGEPGFHPHDPESKAVISVGPLTATATPASGRTNISFFTPMMKNNPISDAHIGGHLAQYMKFAGYDVIIVEGVSPNPVYVKIDNDVVTFEDASHLWGNMTGTFATNQAILKECGPEFTSFAIGPAGENLVYQASIHGSLGNSGGIGVGSIFGSKNMKAMAIRGSGHVMMANPQAVLAETEYYVKELVDAWMTPMPRMPQGWNELTRTGGGWGAGPDRFWLAAPNGPVPTGIQPPGDMNRVGYRAHFVAFGGGAELAVNPARAEQFMVKAAGCALCTVKCYVRYDVKPARDIINHSGKFSQACYSVNMHGNLYPGVPINAANIENSRWFPGGDAPTANAIFQSQGSWNWDNMGIMENYMMTMGDFAYAFNNGFFRRVSEGPNEAGNHGVIPDSQWDLIPWHLMQDRDPAWMQWLLQDMAKGPNNGGTELSWLGMGNYHYSKRWNFPESYWNGVPIVDEAGNPVICSYSGKQGRNTGFESRTNFLGWPDHHSRDGYQASMVRHNLYNRDPISHVLVMMTWHSLPLDDVIRVAEHWWGEGSFDALSGMSGSTAIRGRTPVNDAKINLAHYHFWYYQWSNMGTLCEFVWPRTLSPKAERNYVGDHHIDARFMTAVTGDDWTLEKISRYADKVGCMMRVMTLITWHNEFGTNNLRETRDIYPDQWFDRMPNQNPFAVPGPDGWTTPVAGSGVPVWATDNPNPGGKMCRDDWNKTQDMFFTKLGWDPVTGVPTRATLESLDLGYMADELASRGILPS